MVAEQQFTPGQAAPLVQDRYVPDSEVARITGRSVKSVRRDRARGEGAPWVRIGGSIRYSLRELYTFLSNLPGGGGQ